MITWSPSSWELWKQCPAKYRIKRVDIWKQALPKEDRSLAKLAVPGLVVDRLLQLWLCRQQFDDTTWLDDNFEMIWNLVSQEHQPKWASSGETELSRCETIGGLKIAVQMLREFNLSEYSIHTQPSFREQITSEFSIAGSADLLLVNKASNEATLIDFKNAHSRERMTKDQLLIYQIGLERTRSLIFKRCGYLLFNPRLQEWKWFTFTPDHKAALIEKLSQATRLVEKQEFDYNWNHFSCTRFCEVRFACEKFQQLIGKQRISDDELEGLQKALK